mgnify:CR=1 FL=1
MTIKISDEERVDDLGRMGYRIIQNKGKFCFGMDAVLLSWFAKTVEGDRILDMGTGTGIIPLLMKARAEEKKIACHFTGLEIQEEMAEMAKRTICLNDLSKDITIIKGDIKEASQIFGKTSFSVVTSNPPYMPGNHGLKNPNEAKAISRHEVLCCLEDVVEQAAAVLQQGGRFYMVHRPFRLIEIVSALRSNRLEPKRIQFVHPFLNKEANMVLIEAVRGGGAMVKIEEPLIVYERQGVYTQKILDIYGK